MKSVVRQGLPILVALVSLLISPGRLAGQEEQVCPQHRPRDGVYSSKAWEYVERARDEDSPQDKRGYYNFALRQLLEGIEAEPDNPNYYKMAGEVALELDDYVRADTLWDQAACMWQPYVLAIQGLRTLAWSGLIDQANELLAGGDEAAAMELYSQAYIINDREPHTVFQVATYNVGLAQMAESDSLRRAYMDKARWGFQEALGATGRSESLTEEQRAEFYWTASTNLAQILAFDGEFVQAAAVYEEFLQMYPDHVEARSSLASYLAMRVVELRESAELEQDSAQKEGLLAEADGIQGQVLEQYRALLGMEGMDLGASRYHDMGIGLYELGSYSEAVLAFNRALELEPYRAHSLEFLGHSLYQAERYDTLLVVAEKLVERYPNNVDFLALLAQAWRGNDEPERTLEVLQRREALAFQLSPVSLQGGAIFGELENLNLESGVPVVVEFTFYDSAGNSLGTGSLEMPAPSQEEPVPFRVAPDGGLVAGVTGFTYRVLEPT